MIGVRRVSLTRAGRPVLREVTFDVAVGCVTVVAGPNGAGKSTLLGVMAGDVAASSGGVLIDGKDVLRWSATDLARRRAVMPQETLLSFAFTAEEVVRMGRHPAQRGSHGSADDDEIVLRSMRETETAALADRVFPTLSGGEKARVTLARVLAQESPILFLDEPTASLDPRHQHVVMRTARHVARSGGAVVLVLHDLNLAARYADQVILLKEGRVIAAASPAEVLTASTLETAFDSPFEVFAPYGDVPLVISLPASDDAPQ